VTGGRVKTLVAGLQVPEGIVPRSADVLEVAEQRTNSILLIDLKRHTRSTIVKLPTVPMQSGVDDIEAAPGGATYVPDSANGSLYLLRGSHLQLLAGGMVRPVGVVRWGSGIAIADEYASTIWRLVDGRRTHLASLLVPDDVVVSSGHLLAISLAGKVAGGLWEVAPHLRLVTKAFKNPQGVVTAGADAVIVADQTSNGIYRVAGLSSCL
jgi:hypothetical protein